MKHLFFAHRSDPSANPGGLKSRKRTPQIGLSTLLLATACIAAWGSMWMNQREIERLQPRIAAMSSLARELIVKDRDHIAIVQQHAQLYDQQIWHVYLPNDSLGLHLATRDIRPGMPGDVAKNVGGPISTAPLPAGRHVIELKSELEEGQWITKVLVDDKPVIRVREPKEWNAGRGSSGGGQFPNQADLPVDQPAVLFRRVFMIPDGEMSSTLPTEPSNGIVLWIDALPSPPEPKPC